MFFLLFILLILYFNCLVFHFLRIHQLNWNKETIFQINECQQKLIQLIFHVFSSLFCICYFNIYIDPIRTCYVCMQLNMNSKLVAHTWSIQQKHWLFSRYTNIQMNIIPSKAIRLTSKTTNLKEYPIHWKEKCYLSQLFVLLFIFHQSKMLKVLDVFFFLWWYVQSRLDANWFRRFHFDSIQRIHLIRVFKKKSQSNFSKFRFSLDKWTWCLNYLMDKSMFYSNTSKYFEWKLEFSIFLKIHWVKLVNWIDFFEEKKTVVLYHSERPSFQSFMSQHDLVMDGVIWCHLNIVFNRK